AAVAQWARDLAADLNDVGNADAALKPLKPSHEHAARKLFEHFGQAPGEVQRHFLEVDRQAHDIIGASEAARLCARNEELEPETRRLQCENIALRSEIRELKAQLGARPPPANDGLGIPDFLDRTREATS